MMKKNLMAMMLMIGIAAIPAFSQYGYDAHRFEISPFAGYQFGGKIGVQSGTLSIKDAMNYGAALDIYVRPGFQVELSYNRQDTELRLRDILTGRTSPLFDMTVEYFQIGGLYEMRPGRVRPYGLITVGLTHFNPKPKDRSSEWRLSFSVGGGVKAFVTERFGFRFQGKFLFPYFGAGGGLWCSAPGGCFVSLNGRLAVQADFTGGIFLAF
jgi:opacity protein-like surface antigen